jgi:hypothetical protein
MGGRVVIASVTCDTYLLDHTAMMTAFLRIADVDEGRARLPLMTRPGH